MEINSDTQGYGQLYSLLVNQVSRSNLSYVHNASVQSGYLKRYCSLKCAFMPSVVRPSSSREHDISGAPGGNFKLRR